MRISDLLSRDALKRRRQDPLRRIVARFARGNVLVQQGRYITRAEADEIIERGDQALDRLDELARRG